MILCQFARFLAKKINFKKVGTTTAIIISTRQGQSVTQQLTKPLFFNLWIVYLPNSSS